MMKKRVFSLFLALALCLSLIPAAARTASADDLSVTVGDGTDENSYIPTYSTYNYSKAQIIVPASALSALSGNAITGVAFYPSYAYNRSRTLEIYLSETEAVSLTGFVDASGDKQVFSGIVYFDDNSALGNHLSFSDSYDYQGGNLLITVIDKTGSWQSGLYFSGVNTTGASWSFYTDGQYIGPDYTDGGYARNFLPKMTFTTGGSAPEPLVEYDLYLCGTRVTSANKDDLTVIPGISGDEVSYDPDTATLTLKNASIDGTPTSNYGNAATISVMNSISTLNIDFSGSNVIGCEANTDGMSNALGGLYTNIVFNGADSSSSLNVNARTTPTAENGAVRVASVTVNEGTVTFTAPEEKYEGNNYENNPYGVTLNAASGTLLAVNGGKLICKGWAPVVAGPLENRVDENTVLKGSTDYNGSNLEDYDYSTNGYYNSSGKFQGTYRYVTATPYEAAPVTVNISFNANGGGGTMDPVEVTTGEDYTLPDCGFTAPDGKEFDGWDKGAAGSTINVSEDTVVTAQWKDLPATLDYDITEGENASWKKGSSTDLAFTIVRTLENETAYSHFLGVEVDRMTLAEKNYTAESGSVKLTLKASYLETLSAGTHTLTVLFDDGAAETQFTVGNGSYIVPQTSAGR